MIGLGHIGGWALALAIGTSFPCAATEIRVAVGSTLPPYFILADDSGIEMDIIRAAMAEGGRTMIPMYLEYGTMEEALQQGLVDCVSTINERSGARAHYSDVVISYQNYAITLAQSRLKIDKVADLKGKAIIAFPNAHKVLGAEYAAAVADNPYYWERGNQLLQTGNLFLGRTQVLIGDFRIFNHYGKKLASRSQAQQPVVFHDLFPKTDYKIACNDQRIIDDFNRGLRWVRNSGLYDKIVAKYQ